MKKFVIVGTGRSGTGFCSRVMNLSGAKCGHQTVFQHHNVHDGSWEWGDYDGDASFEAVPALDRLDGVTKVLVVRDPFKVVKSWLDLGVFRHDMRINYELFSRAIDGISPLVMEQSSPDQRAFTYWTEWNWYARGLSDFTFKLESDDIAGSLREAVGFRGGDVPPSFNHLENEKIYDVHVSRVPELPGEVSIRFAMLCEELGYA